tara:strand:- start:3 stop:263 length:261 start_codon:yes stop_codon:yes gene_type:complete
MISLKLIEMRNKVKEELEYIPTGDIKQNMLRQIYFTIRMNSLGKKAKYPNDKKRILRIAIEHEKEYLKKKGEIFKPNYDKNYFKIK